jgi:uncharacterized protein YdaU (DUF1376 family)
MSAITHIPFYPSDWLAGTRGMTAAEMGVYITILAMIYERAGPIKADDMAKLARLCGTSASALKGILESLIADEKLTLVDGHLSNRRAELEIKNVMAKSEVAKANINARWEKRQAKSTAAEYGGNTDEILANSHKPNSTSSLRSDVPRAKRASPPGFDEFWLQYPQKVGRGAALKAFVKARSEADQATIMAGLARYAAKQDDRPWCNPATWLNQQRWLDAPAAQGPPAAKEHKNHEFMNAFAKVLNAPDSGNPEHRHAVANADAGLHDSGGAFEIEFAPVDAKWR